MDFGSYRGFWVVTGILGLKSGTNAEVIGTCMRRKVPRHTHSLLWECMEPLRRTLIHIKGASRGLMHKKISGTQGLVMGMNRKAFRSLVVGIKGLCCGFQSIPFKFTLEVESCHSNPSSYVSLGKLVKVGRYEGRHHYRVVLEQVALSLGNI